MWRDQKSDEFSSDQKISEMEKQDRTKMFFCFFDSFMNRFLSCLSLFPEGATLFILSHRLTLWRSSS
ncbi:hypothetical protein R3I93_007662 [Phoxinus phoxinus]|uniref:Uncharacterized protein n=1 Tax=Phoxinus phoxinus TaxID=58324 RepID=A0AAN9D8B2_9TELE